MFSRRKPTSVIILAGIAFVFVITGYISGHGAELNVLTGEERGGGWRLLFDGQTLQGWTYPARSWTVDNGAIVAQGGGDLYTIERFHNFFFQCEFKMATNCNSGIFLRVGDPLHRPETSFEIQISDDYGQVTVDSHSAGAIYHRQPPLLNAIKPTGEWNRFLILCMDNIVKIRLNDQLVVDADVNNWTIPHVNPDGTWNKFKEPLSALTREGHIGIQCHGNDTGGRLWLRNVKILILP